MTCCSTATIQIACDEIDAGFFSGDAFHTPEACERMEYYIARWQRAIAEIREDNFYVDDEES
jgi:hypothetical protein